MPTAVDLGDHQLNAAREGHAIEGGYVQRAQPEDQRDANLLSPGLLQLAHHGVWQRQDHDVAQDLGDGEPEQRPGLRRARGAVGRVGDADEALEEEEEQAPADHQDHERVRSTAEPRDRAEDATIEKQDAQFDECVGHLLDDHDRMVQLRSF